MIRKEKQQQLIQSFISALPASHQDMFRELSEYAISLGYTPQKTKTQHYALDFTKSKVRKTILKLEVHENGIDQNNPGLRLKFYASKEYSDIFKNGIKKVIEEFGGRYTGCYGCGRCKGALEGYMYTYGDGRKVFRCGSELIAIHGFGPDDLAEIKALMKEQDNFYEEQYHQKCN